MSLEAAVAVVGAIAGAYMDHRRAGEEDEQRRDNREALLQALEKLRENLIADIVELRLNELRSQIRGLQQVYRSYAPRPNDEVEEGRLVRVIDNAALTIGAIQQELLVDPEQETELAVRAITPYLAIVFLRAQAQTERWITYGASEQEDSLITFEEALAELAPIEPALRRDTARRFGAIQCGRHPDFPPGVEMCMYTFDGHSIVCGSLNDPTGVAKCHQMRNDHEVSSYLASGGALLQAAQSGLDEAARALRQEEFRRVAIGLGLATEGTLRMVDGRLKLARFPATARLDEAPSLTAGFSVDPDHHIESA